MGNGWSLGRWGKRKKNLGDEIEDGIRVRGVDGGTGVQTRGWCRTGGRLSAEFKINLTIHLHQLLIMLTKIVINKIVPTTLCGRADIDAAIDYFSQHY